MKPRSTVYRLANHSASVMMPVPPAPETTKQGGWFQNCRIVLKRTLNGGPEEGDF